MLGLLVLFPAAPRAQTPNLILDIQIKGAVQTTEGEIFSILSSRIGNPLERELITKDIKTIFSLGFFQNVQAEVEEEPGRGYILRFLVREKPRITSIRVLGNVKIGKDKIFEAMTLQVGSYFNKSQLDSNLEKIRAVYRAAGYLKVKLTPQIVPRTEYAYDLTIQIEETPRFYITDIRIKGTQVFSELDLVRLMTTAEVDCFDWITDSGVFDTDKINQDLQIITTQYLIKGYIRVFIDKPKITLIHNRDFSRIIVELTITEGAQYFTGKVDIAGDVLGDKQQLLDRLTLKPGAPHNVIQRTQDLFRLQEVYQEQGYAFVRIQPDIQINDTTKIVDTTYRITKNEKAYIGRIEFQGNLETRDYVLRREFEVRENELYNGRKLRISQRNLTALGFFEPSLSIETSRREDENILDLSTRVKETQTGTFQVQMGYSDQTGLSLGFSLSKGNFMGRGQTLRTSAQFSQRSVTRNLSVDFIEPHLFGTDFSSDSSISHRALEDQSELDRGLIKEISGSQGFGYPIFSSFRINFSLSATNRDFEEIDVDPIKLRTFTTAFSYNTVNHPIFPTDGTRITLGISQVGGKVLGGSTEFRRYRFQYRTYSSLNEDNTLILSVRFRLGFLEKVGNNVIPAEERFRLGGLNSLRGYRNNEVGGPYGRLERNINSISVLLLDDFGQPVLDAGGNPVYQNVDTRTLGLDEATLEKLRGGGTLERLINVEMLFPLAGPTIRGVVFYDAGQVNAEAEQYQILDEEEPRFFDLLHSVGAGFRIITPLGVFRFEYGRKLKVREGESPDEFDFTVSTLF